MRKHYVTETIHERHDGSLFSGGPVEETDGGCDGLAWVSVSDLPKHGIDREQAAKNLKAEIEEYGAYRSGDAYGYVVTDLQTDEHDSCWGFFGIEWANRGREGSRQGHRIQARMVLIGSDGMDAVNLSFRRPTDEQVAQIRSSEIWSRSMASGFRESMGVLRFLI